ncbi:putative conserved protein YukE [Streptoalloteichus tenebrarius]|uniref:Conserved protein YukE n=1 Tax=Streptoalloteichus tenebrarius (strain ATCC 17920 / DSM 40477 / JCM 4838 / CBS 697.72 / NBRC 16177 / NCIMB 11028 / NRRL B-12390 / A12253. 1 / ISP 5477) TaxID=1933 RepID=A0ABT1I171_STRSD|nr:type VII secretion target [Streptoalloteichus tenebrarius]MCP2261532.1 putative conserved protein YukE [Streptoalloteichus tenebrarius]BFE99308.1 hypothetical protein GCM10020241_09840 [Streptoalloteichus tenebrarius]
MDNGFRVDSEQVRSHAGPVGGFAGRAHTAAEAGATVTDLNDAYGLFCRPFAAMLKPAQQRGADALKECAELLDRTVEDLRKVADTYQEAEDKEARRMEEILARLGDVPSAPTVDRRA